MTNENGIPFTKRFGLNTRSLVDKDFPRESRIAVFHVLREFIDRNKAKSWYDVICELERLARVAPFEERGEAETREDRALQLLLDLQWSRVFEFCERMYAKLLCPVTHQGGFEVVEDVPLSEVRAASQKELNRILMEDNFAFVMESGRFVRPGHHHLQQAAAAANKVLARPGLTDARLHYVKAQRFFESGPLADYPNAVKEAVAALEAAVKALFGEKESDVRKTLAKLKGTRENEIPPTLVKAADDIYNFRGAAEGVAHGGASGGTVTAEVAELVMSLVAGFITYLTALADRRNADLPF